MNTVLDRPLTVEDDDAVRVDAAAKWLDANHPGWAEKIDLDNFEMGCYMTCIGHYLGVDWWYGLYLPHERDTGNSSISLFSSCNSLWRGEITHRLTN